MQLIEKYPIHDKSRIVVYCYCVTISVVPIPNNCKIPFNITLMKHTKMETTHNLKGKTNKQKSYLNNATIQLK